MRRDALAAWNAGLRAAAPAEKVACAVEHSRLFDRRVGRVLVVATGKAAGSMVSALPRRAEGFAIVPGGYRGRALPQGIEVLAADHPVPSRRGFAASRRVLAAVEKLGRDDTLLYLISGGTSALFEVPAAGLDDDEVIAVYRLLLASGAPIEEINTVRASLSAVKAGGLARAAAPANSLTLAVSDVAGDDPATIGSGPTVARPCSAGEAVAVLERWGLWPECPESLCAWLERSRRHAEEDCTGAFEVVVSEGAAAEGAARWLEAAGYRLQEPPLERLGGSTTELAPVLAEAVRRVAGGGRATAFLLHGETTVRLPADAGTGGRNQHLAAELALRLTDVESFACVVAGTDGIDGSSDAAGALIDGSTAARARAAGADLTRALETFATTVALEAAGDVLRTGPTGTNLGDLLVVTAGRQR